MCAAVSKVFDIFEKDHILEHVRELTPYLEEKLDALVDKYGNYLPETWKRIYAGTCDTGYFRGDDCK